MEPIQRQNLLGWILVGITVIVGVIAFVVIKAAVPKVEPVRRVGLRTPAEEAARRQRIAARDAERAEQQQRAEYLASLRPPPLPPRDPIDVAIENLLDLKVKQIVHSIDVNRGQMRINTLFWGMLSIETKQGMVTALSHYCQRNGGRKWVTILSDRNDTVLATNDGWDGVKILQ